MPVNERMLAEENLIGARKLMAPIVVKRELDSGRDSREDGGEDEDECKPLNQTMPATARNLAGRPEALRSILHQRAGYNKIGCRLCQSPSNPIILESAELANLHGSDPDASSFESRMRIGGEDAV